jgi:hypothetical protein
VSEPPIPSAVPPDLLPYRFSTLPAPLQVSAASAASPGAINIWAGLPQDSVYCSKIVIGVPVGPAGTDLTTQTPSVTPNTTWWAISSLVIETGDHLGLSADISYAVFTAVATSDAHWLIDYDLQFSIVTAQVNQTEGTFGLVIAETSGPASDQLEQRRSVFDLTKGPVTGYLNNIMTTAAPPGPTDIPLSEFTAGQPVRLAWASNASSFAVYVGSATTPVWTGPDTSTVLSAGLTSDATLTVVATSDLGVLIAGTTVVITNPALTPASVTAGILTATGLTKLAAVALANLSTASLGATGPATLAGGARASTLSATGGAVLRGRVTSSSAAVTGNLTVGGSAQLGAASMASLRLTNTASIMNPRSIGAGSYVASSDGLVVGTVGWPNNAGLKCAAVAYGSSAGAGTVYARGGNRVFWVSSNAKNFSSWMVGGSFLLPVRRGYGFTVGVYQVNGNDVAAPTSFAWVPFGTSASLRELSPDEAIAWGLDAITLPPPWELSAPPVGTPVSQLMEVIAGILGDRLTPELRHRLRRAVLTLATGH